MLTYVSGSGIAADCGWVIEYIVAPQKAAGGEGMDAINAARNAACATAFAGPVLAAEIAFWIAIALAFAGVALLARSAVPGQRDDARRGF